MCIDHKMSLANAVTHTASAVLCSSAGSVAYCFWIEVVCMPNVGVFASMSLGEVNP